MKSAVNIRQQWSLWQSQGLSAWMDVHNNCPCAFVSGCCVEIGSDCHRGNKQQRLSRTGLIKHSAAVSSRLLQPGPAWTRPALPDTSPLPWWPGATASKWKEEEKEEEKKKEEEESAYSSSALFYSVHRGTCWDVLGQHDNEERKTHFPQERNVKKASDHREDELVN